MLVINENLYSVVSFKPTSLKLCYLLNKTDYSYYWLVPAGQLQQVLGYMSDFIKISCAVRVYQDIMCDFMYDLC